MEQDTILKEVLSALNDHSKQINQKMDSRFDSMEERLEAMEKKMDNGFNHLSSRVDGYILSYQNFLLIYKR